MKLNQAINRILRLSGHQSVNAVTDGDQAANTALNTLVAVRQDILSTPYNFNHVVTSFPKDTTGRVPVARTWLSVMLPHPRLALRDDTTTGGLYIWNQREDDWHTAEVRRAICSYDIPNFESLPNTFAQWITYEAAEMYYAEHKGNPSNYLMNRRNKRKAIAIRKNPPLSVNMPTGHNLVRIVHEHRDVYA